MSETRTCPHCKVEFAARDLGDRTDCPVCGCPLNKSAQEHAQNWVQEVGQTGILLNSSRHGFSFAMPGILFVFLPWLLKTIWRLADEFLDSMPLPANLSRWKKPALILILLAVSGGIGAWLAMRR